MARRTKGHACLYPGSMPVRNSTGAVVTVEDIWRAQVHTVMFRVSYYRQENVWTPCYGPMKRGSALCVGFHLRSGRLLKIADTSRVRVQRGGVFGKMSYGLLKLKAGAVRLGDQFWTMNPIDVISANPCGIRLVDPVVRIDYYQPEPVFEFMRWDGYDSSVIYDWQGLPTFMRCNKRR